MVRMKRRGLSPMFHSFLKMPEMMKAAMMPVSRSAAGWDRKLRRRYEKLIRSRARRDVRLRAMTPAELEAEARLAGPGAETVHVLYEQTRYSQSPADRERYAAFKAAVKTLEPQPPREAEGEG